MWNHSKFGFFIVDCNLFLQFSCAAPIEGVNNKNQRDVWVCNSDGYVGHMCLLSLQPEPIVTLNTPVPGCNSRILCICAVPGLTGFKRYIFRTHAVLHRTSLYKRKSVSVSFNLRFVTILHVPNNLRL